MAANKKMPGIIIRDVAVVPGMTVNFSVIKKEAAKAKKKEAKAAAKAKKEAESSKSKSQETQE